MAAVLAAVPGTRSVRLHDACAQEIRPKTLSASNMRPVSCGCTHTSRKSCALKLCDSTSRPSVLDVIRSQRSSGQTNQSAEPAAKPTQLLGAAYLLCFSETSCFVGHFSFASLAGSEFLDLGQQRW